MEQQTELPGMPPKKHNSERDAQIVVIKNKLIGQQWTPASFLQQWLMSRDTATLSWLDTQANRELMLLELSGWMTSSLTISVLLRTLIFTLKDWHSISSDSKEQALAAMQRDFDSFMLRMRAMK
jgi:hypothetical protein